MAVTETYYRISGDFSLYEQASPVTVQGTIYDAVFDPFELTDLGQKFLGLTTEDMAEFPTVAFIIPTNLATGEVSTNFRSDEYFDDETGNFVATFHQGQELMGSFVIRRALSADIQANSENTLNIFNGLVSNFNGVQLDADLNIISTAEPMFETWVVTSTPILNVDLTSISASEIDGDEITFIPTRIVDSVTGDFFATPRTIFGSAELDIISSEFGDTHYDSIKNSGTYEFFGADSKLDLIRYDNAPSAVTINFADNTIMDGWGTADTFASNKFSVFWCLIMMIG